MKNNTNYHAYEIVMNNIDLRRIILSYFREKHEIVCYTCKKTCVWGNKTIKMYVELPTKDYSVIYYQCLECNWIANTRDIMGY